MIGNPFVVKMIESTIDKTAREIKNNPTKGVKSLVGLANRHASSPVQKDLVASLQTMLGDPNSPLYRIIPALINDVHPKTFKTFIMNIAYNSWSYGGKKIKQYEKVYNINIPWTIVFDFTKETARPLNTHTILSVIEQGKKVGIYTYLFFINSMDNLPDVLEQNPDCAFMLYILPTTLTNENIAMIKSYHNTFFSVLYHPGINVEAFKKSINLLYNNHCLFGTHSYYNNENTNYILSNK